jgi:cyclopropane fatty-acyl-phospholipid synthase-like methyltransferase
MDEGDYSYPDADDKITAFMIAEREHAKGSWERGEQKILELIGKYLKKSPDSWLLDAGCGTGRLLPHFQVYFDRILAIDRDAAQIERAKALVRKFGFENKVVFKVSSMTNLTWPEESVDSILCSHLIQHIATDQVPQVILKTKALLKLNGTLFLITTHGKEDYFAKEYLKGHRLFEEKISQGEFNSLVENKNNILPIHFFSKRTIQKILQESGFCVSVFSLFHKITGNETGKENFRDMMLIARKERP